MYLKTYLFSYVIYLYKIYMNTKTIAATVFILAAATTLLLLKTDYQNKSLTADGKVKVDLYS